LAVQYFAERYLIPLQLILAMVGMGATLSVQDFIAVVRDAKGLLVGLVLQLLYVPLVALGLIEIFGLSRGWAVGLILVSVVPGGAFSNLLTYIGRGNAALSVSVTTVSNVACIVTIPLLLRLLVSEYVPPEFAVPTRHVVSDIFWYLLGPLAGGMSLLRLRSTLAAPVARWTIRGSVVLLAFVVVSSLGSGRIRVFAYGWGPPATIILFGTLLWVGAAQLSRIVRRYDDDTVAITLEIVIRNVAVALLLVKFFFPGEAEQAEVLYTCLFYAGFSFCVGFPLAARSRRGHALALFWPRHIRPPRLDPSARLAASPSSSTNR
jgi:bile acid:Na+ symporter, BASS family